MVRGSDILIVDDEKDIRTLVCGILQDEGYQTRLAAGAARAYEAVSEKIPDLVVLDIWLQGSDHDGIEILRRIKEQHPEIPVIMISGHGTIETAVSAIKEGAYDFIEKPFKADRLLVMVKRALEAAGLKKENALLKGRADVPVSLTGESAPVKNLRQVLARVAPTNSRVLLTGEQGVGKNVAARIIHCNSPRRGKPFFVLNCATLLPNNLEVELFGKATGKERRCGVFELANGGTLLLDEVSDMPLKTQGKIARILQEQRFQRVGSSEMIELDVRVIATTNRNLEEAIKAGEFREDLYYRLNVVPVHVPPLRERVQDIPDFVGAFSKEISRQSGLPVHPFLPEALAAMKDCAWPGNIRQLRNVVEWVMIMNGANVGEKGYELRHLPSEFWKNLQEHPPESVVRRSPSHYALLDMPLREAREEFERKYLLSQVKRFEGNVSKTAQFVGMERSALHRKLKSLQIIGADKHDSYAEAHPMLKRKT